MQADPAFLVVALVNLAAAIVLLLLVVVAVLAWRRIEGELVNRVLRRCFAAAPHLEEMRAELADLADAQHARLAALAEVDRELRQQYALQTQPLPTVPKRRPAAPTDGPKAT